MTTRFAIVACLAALAYCCAPAELHAQALTAPESEAVPRAQAGGPRVFQSRQQVFQSDEPDWVEGSSVEGNSVEPLDPETVPYFRRRRLFERPPGRYALRGDPLTNESWMNRPFSFGILSGALFLDSPLKGRVNGMAGYMPGIRLGWDTDYFWGIESRIAYSTTGLQTPTNGTALGNARVLLADSNLLYYPWGDTKWRPYATIGMGLMDILFTNDVGTQVHQTAFNMPFGVGFKVRHSQQWVFRLDLVDNLAFAAGDQMNTMNSLSLTAGLELRLGTGPRRSCWPWNPTKSFR
jgi:hypothetical protein